MRKKVNISIKDEEIMQKIDEYKKNNKINISQICTEALEREINSLVNKKEKKEITKIYEVDFSVIERLRKEKTGMNFYEIGYKQAFEYAIENLTYKDLFCEDLWENLCVNCITSDSEEFVFNNFSNYVDITKFNETFLNFLDYDYDFLLDNGDIKEIIEGNKGIQNWFKGWIEGVRDFRRQIFPLEENNQGVEA